MNLCHVWSSWWLWYHPYFWFNWHDHECPVFRFLWSWSLIICKINSETQWYVCYLSILIHNISYYSIILNLIHWFFNLFLSSCQVGNMIFWFIFSILGQPMCVLLYYHDLMNRKGKLDWSYGHYILKVHMDLIYQVARLIHLDLCTYQLSSGNCIKICNFESHTLALITAKEQCSCFLLNVN